MTYYARNLPLKWANFATYIKYYVVGKTHCNIKSVSTFPATLFGEAIILQKMDNKDVYSIWLGFNRHLWVYPVWTYFNNRVFCLLDLAICLCFVIGCNMNWIKFIDVSIFSVKYVHRIPFRRSLFELTYFLSAGYHQYKYLNERVLSNM